jgi:hypothetical protein
MKILVKPHYKTPGKPVDQHRMANMVRAAQNLVTAARANASAEHKESWFGAYGASKSQEIDDRCQKIETYLNSLKRLTFRYSSEPGSIASYGQKLKEKREGGPSINELNGSPAININSGFHQGRYSWGEKVCSILHEITHVTIGTSDVLNSKGQHVYGAVDCAELKKTDPALAYKNADNWAYYFGSYYRNTRESGNDWRYMTVEEVARRVAHTIKM